MPDDVKIEGAAPSAAVTTETNPYASGKLTKELSQTWTDQKTQPKNAATATADTSKETKSEGKPESAAAPDSARETQEKGSRRKPSAEERIAQLTAEIKTLKESKTEPKQATETKTAAPSTAKPVEVKTLEAPKEPSMEDPKYAGDDGWKLYEADVKKFNRELAAYEGKKAVEDYKREQNDKQNAERVAKEFEAAEKKYPDYKDKTQPLIDALIAEVQAAPEAKTIHPVVLEAIGSNPLCADILYVLGPNKDEFLALAKSNPVAALEKVAVIKHLISEELAASVAKVEEPKEVKPKEEKKTPVKTNAEEPQPTHEVGNRGTGPNDVAADAVRRGKFSEASREWTRRAAERAGRG